MSGTTEPRGRFAGPKSFAERLVDELEAIEADFTGIVQGSTIRRSQLNDSPGGVVFVGFPDFYWQAHEFVAERTAVLRVLNDWLALFELLHRGALPETRERIEKAEHQLRIWLERDGSDHSVPRTTAEALNIAAQTFNEFRALVALATTGERETLVVPDTNVLLRNPGVETYADVVGTDRYTAVLVPAVMAELDDLKDRGRTPDLRESATRAVRRIKGLRDRGALHVGVRVAGQVNLRAEARDLVPTDILNWLRPEVADDRILAASLDLQARAPASVVVLLTADLNLQNKAAVARMPFAEPNG